MANFPSITHVAVTVTDLERSTRWYSELLGAGPVLDEDEQTGGFHHTVFALDGGQLFGLHTHPNGAGGRFDEHRTGLDHVAFACHDRGELQAWANSAAQLATAGRLQDRGLGAPAQRSTCSSAWTSNTRPRLPANRGRRTTHARSCAISGHQAVDTAAHAGRPTQPTSGRAAYAALPYAR